MKRCDICGTEHQPWQAHVFASNKVTASNNASNAGRQVVVSGSAGNSGDERGEVGSKPSAVVGDSGNGLRKQRWSRDSYNAYMREYMRQRRASSRNA